MNDAVIQTVIEEFQQQAGNEWAPVQQSGPDEYDQDYGVNVEDRDQPLTRLRDRLAQSKQVLSLQGDLFAELLARNLAFGSVITSLESFLWETVLYWVEHDDDTVRNIVTKIPYFRDQPLKLGQLFEKRESLRNDVKAYLQNLVWHRWSRVAPLFTSGLGLKIPSFKQFDAALLRRHDIVHRSGLSKAGDPVQIAAGELESLCEQVLAFALEINAELAQRGSFA